MKLTESRFRATCFDIVDIVLFDFGGQRIIQLVRRINSVQFESILRANEL